jgi:uncharacterized protein YjiS (DUF1127 family)
MTTITEAKERSHSSSWASLGVAMDHIVRTLMAWHDRAQGRRQLLSLSDHILKDIGRSRADIAMSMPHLIWIMGESDQPFWWARMYPFAPFELNAEGFFRASACLRPTLCGQLGIGVIPPRVCAKSRRPALAAI